MIWGSCRAKTVRAASAHEFPQRRCHWPYWWWRICRSAKKFNRQRRDQCSYWTSDFRNPWLVHWWNWRKNYNQHRHLLCSGERLHLYGFVPLRRPRPIPDQTERPRRIHILYQIIKIYIFIKNNRFIFLGKVAVFLIYLSLHPHFLPVFLNIT